VLTHATRGESIQFSPPGVGRLGHLEGSFSGRARWTTIQVSYDPHIMAKPSNALPPTAYPETGPKRDRWILAHRSGRHAVDAFQANRFHLEEERAESGEVVSVATIFLTNRECPWRCLMCDLWKHTLSETVPLGAIPAQIDKALAQLLDFDHPSHPAAAARDDLAQPAREARQVKLYNSGSFFDPRAIPPADYAAIADRVRRFERVIVECHPALVGESAVQFRDMLGTVPTTARGISGTLPKLEVAMGLETAHPGVLHKLNKRMTLSQFAKACAFLRAHEVAVRAFILVKPPFLEEDQALAWAERSLDFAFESGATTAVLIPTRVGNGALEALAACGEFSPPRLATLEAAMDYGLGLHQGRVFADLWDLGKFAECQKCFAARADRLLQMNLQQRWLAKIACHSCHAN
jgi:radical SAM enzyme (TIGR01210 family)